VFFPITQSFLGLLGALNEHLSDLAVEAVEVYVENGKAYVTGRRLVPLLKKLIAFENLLARFGKSPYQTDILRVFADQPELNKDLLKNVTAFERAVEAATQALMVAYPKATVSMEIADDEEHQSSKVACRLQLNGMTHSLEIGHALVASADFRELQKGSPAAIGMGQAPYKVKTEGVESQYATAGELVKAILAIGKHGLSIQRYKGLGEMNADQLWDTTMNPETRTLLRVKLEDVTGVDEIFSILMGDEVEPRRDFIQRHALEVRNLDV